MERLHALASEDQAAAPTAPDGEGEVLDPDPARGLAVAPDLDHDLAHVGLWQAWPPEVGSLHYSGRAMNDPAWLEQRHGNRFQVQGLLGSGGMGDILLAHDRNLDRTVALKRLRVMAPDLRRRAVREAEILARVRHPNLVQLFDFLPDEDGGVLVLEYLEGADLGKGCSAVDALAALLDVADALEALHEAGLIHRDVKPSNVLRTADGRAVLLDLGLAYADGASRVTESGAVVGTPNFLAPELLLGRPPTPGVDWYGWGLTLFRVLEQRPAFLFADLVAAVNAGQMPPLRFEVISPEGPEAALICACLALRPEERPHGRIELESFLRRPSSRDRPRRESPERRRTAVLPGPLVRRSSPTPAAAGRPNRGGLLGVLVGAAAVMAWLRSEAPAPGIPGRTPGPSPYVEIPPGPAPTPGEGWTTAWGQVTDPVWIARSPIPGRPLRYEDAVARCRERGARLPRATELARARALGLLQGQLDQLAWTAETAHTMTAAHLWMAWDMPPLRGSWPPAPGASPPPRWPSPAPDPDAWPDPLDPHAWWKRLAESEGPGAYRRWVATGGAVERLEPPERRARELFDEELALRGLPAAHGPSLGLRPMETPIPVPSGPGRELPVSVAGWTGAAVAALGRLEREVAARRDELRALTEEGTPIPGAGERDAIIRLVVDVSPTDLQFVWRCAREPTLEDWLPRWLRDAGDQAEGLIHATGRALRAEETHAPAVAALVVDRLGSSELNLVFAGHLRGSRATDLLGDERLPSSPWGWYFLGAVQELMDGLSGEPTSQDRGEFPAGLRALQRSLVPALAPDPARTLRQASALVRITRIVAARLPPGRERRAAEARIAEALEMVELPERASLTERLHSLWANVPVRRP
jgi:hypothetical protein